MQRRRRRLKTEGGSRRRFAGAEMTGAELRAERTRANLSQVELGERAGYHPSYLGWLEGGGRSIGARAARILRASIRAALDEKRTHSGTSR